MSANVFEDVDSFCKMVDDLKSSAEALELAQLSQPATVIGGNNVHELMFSRRSGEICMLTVKEGYGDRLASLNVRVTQDSARYQGNVVWEIFFNNKPVMSFATRDLAMQAFNDASFLLSEKFKIKATDSSVEIQKFSPDKEESAPALWKEVAKVSSVVVVAIFTICMAVRGAANLLPTPDEKRDSAVNAMRHRSPYSVNPLAPKILEPSPEAEGSIGTLKVLPENSDERRN